MPRLWRRRKPRALTGDFDNDGWPDIFVACDSTPSLIPRHLTRFRRRHQHSLQQPRRGRRHFDNDEAVEILVNNSHDRPSLLKNLGEHGNWILLKLEGTKSNRDAIGAKVTVRVGDHQQTQEVRSGDGLHLAK